MKLNRQLIPSVLYVIFTILNIFLWFPFPEICHFMGASSVIYAFLLAVGTDQQLLAYLAVIWIPIFITSLFICFIFVLVRKRYLPFLLIVGFELLVSMFILGIKITTHNYSDLGIAIIGYVIRLGYFFWMLQFTRNACKPFKKSR